MNEDRARQLLGNERQRLERLVGDVRANGSMPDEDAGDELAHYDQHEADAGTETFEREKDMGILESLEGQLADLEAALARVEDGTYGQCEACGEPIPEERIEARPTARFCVQHEPTR